MKNNVVYGSFENDEWEPIAPGRTRHQAVETTIKEVGVLHTLPKTISQSGSFVLLFNNIVTAALFDLPTVFRDSGIVPTTIMLFATCFLSAICAIFLAEGISKSPGNSLFELNVGYSSAFRNVSTDRRFNFGVAFLFLSSLLSQIVVTIVLTAQAWDSFFAFYLFEKAYAYRIIPTLETLSWSRDGCDSDCVPFEDDTGYLYTVGMFVTTALTLPFGLLNLKENMWIQWLTFWCTVLLSAGLLVRIAFVVPDAYQFSALADSGSILSSNFPAWFGERYSKLFGVCLFLYAGLPISVPAWLTEKNLDVSVTDAIWVSSISSFATYFIVGFLGALAFPGDGDNLLAWLGGLEDISIEVMSLVFNVLVFAFGIPVFAIIIRETVQDSTQCHPAVAYFFGGIFPFLISWLLYQGDLSILLIEWSGILFSDCSSFLLPLLLAYYLPKRVKHTLQVSDKGYVVAGEEILENVYEGFNALPGSLTAHRTSIIVGLIVSTGLLTVLDLLLKTFQT